MQKIGLAELEIRRFQKKLNVNSKPDLLENTEKSKKLLVNMPSKVFGHAYVEVAEKHLISLYTELYFHSPQNLKHKTINKFILEMCSSAKSRYNRKKDLLSWARTERDERWLVLISFMDEEKVSGETFYYKQECILWRLSDLKATYRDILHVISMNGKIGDGNVVRLHELAAELDRLKEWGDGHVTRSIEKLAKIEGCEGRQEDKFWKNIIKQGNVVCEKMNVICEKVKSAVPDDALINFKKAAKSKSRSKNLKKELKRKSRAEVAASQK